MGGKTGGLLFLVASAATGIVPYGTTLDYKTSQEFDTTQVTSLLDNDASTFSSGITFVQSTSCNSESDERKVTAANADSVADSGRSQGNAGQEETDADGVRERDHQPTTYPAVLDSHGRDRDLSLANASEDVTEETTTENSQTPDGRRGDSGLIHTGTVSSEQSELIHAATIYTSLPLAATGVLLNSLSVAVYVQPAMRSACSSYLVALALAQLLYLLLVLVVPLTSLLLYTTTGKKRTFFFNVISLHVPNFAMSSLRRTAFALTFVISFERCLAVAFPIKSRSWGVHRYPKVISTLLVVLILGLHVPQVFKYQILPFGSDYVARLSRWWQENSEVLGAVEVGVRVLLVYLPLLGTLLCNVVTVLALRHHRRKRLTLQEGWQQAQQQQQRQQHHRQQQRQQQRDADSSTTGRRAEVQRTVAILVSTLVFVLLSLPTHLLALLNNYHPQLGYRKREHYLYLALTQVFTLLEVLSNISDFAAFYALCTRFRETLKVLIKCRGRRFQKRRRSMAQVTYSPSSPPDPSNANGRSTTTFNE